jgi:hypothetical protein
LTAPVLTVLLPLRHYHSVYLKKAVDSIIGQTCPYWNMLVIVDGENVSTPFYPSCSTTRSSVLNTLSRKVGSS